MKSLHAGTWQNDQGSVGVTGSGSKSHAFVCLCECVYKSTLAAAVFRAVP